MCICRIVSVICITTAAALLKKQSTEGNENRDISKTIIGNESLNILHTLLFNSWPIDDNISDSIICQNQTKWLEAILEGQRALKAKVNLEKFLVPVSPDSASFKHQKVFLFSKKSLLLENAGYIREVARKYFGNGLNKICNQNNAMVMQSFCTDYNAAPCNVEFKFRSFNGFCNNLEHKNFGMAYQTFRRALLPDYADGISKPRVGKNGVSLPSPRTVSLKIHKAYNKEDNKFTVILAVWGQFLDHDITATALSHAFNGISISCCNDDVALHPECFPVQLDIDDPYYQNYNTTCMEFVRSAPAPTCCLGYREQINQATSFIDGSVIYGNDDKTAKSLRTMKGGELRMYKTSDKRTLLPVSRDQNDGCNRQNENNKGRYCFLTGDARANENLYLTSMHLVWARQHNFIAKTLSTLNPHWSDERTFQETRKIIGAQIQHITYNEFLPTILGTDLVEKLDLLPKRSGYFNKYNNKIDASIANHFATAAFRFAHSIIPGLMKISTNNTSSLEFIQLHKMLFDPFKLYDIGELDRVLMGAMDTNIQANDQFFSNELKQHLFEGSIYNKTKSCGLDLVSLNIQRGRDHGLVGYNSWREHCGLKKVSTFEQLQGTLDKNALADIQKIYRSVDDVDLYTGALSEKPIFGSMLGPTFACLIGDQFLRLKIGDRFWYENPKWFTKKQLEEIRKTTLGKIFCDNSDKLESVQRLAMEKVKNENEVVLCKTLEQVSLDLWIEPYSNVKLSSDTIGIKTIS